jgi:lysophospholipase L1-like esterase
VHRVVALGDSVATGTACGCDDYVALLARTLDRRQDASVTSTNLAVGGATSADVLTQLSGEHTRSALSRADLVVVTIGANDVESVSDPTSCLPPGSGVPQGDDVVEACYRRQLSALEANLDRMLGEVASARGPGARVLVTGYWNVFLDGAIARAKGPAYVALADAATRAVNRRIEAAASAHGATYVDLFAAFRGSDGSEDCTPLLAPDGDHLSAQGHALIARTLADALA